MRFIAALTAIVLALPTVALAEDYEISLKDHQFTPRELVIPAGQKVKILVKNLSNLPAEFESTEFNREKILTPGSEGTIYVGPLDTGRYGYFDDFHRESTGTIVAK